VALKEYCRVNGAKMESDAIGVYKAAEDRSTASDGRAETLSATGPRQPKNVT
jgi:hypothetical protein